MDKITRIDTCSYQLAAEFTKPLENHPIPYIFNLFEKNNHSIRVVGGAVRDILLHRFPKDIDFATDAKPEEIKDICEINKIRCVETGLRHGTLTLVIDKCNYEVTTLRIDRETDGRHAVVEFTEDWWLDAERRDLTVNAMSITSSGVLYDYFTGLKDLYDQHVRFVNDPTQRIKEDYLRILRYFRFYAKIAHHEATLRSFDEKVLEIIKDLSPNLERISVERIWLELSQILVGKFGPSIFQIMNKLGLLKYCGFKDVIIDVDCYQKYYEAAMSHQHSDSIPKVKPCSLLAGLLKNVTDSERLCRSIKLSNNERNTCSFIIQNRMDREILQGSADSLKHYKEIVVCNQNKGCIDHTKDRVIQLMLCEGATTTQIVEIINWEVPRFPISGSDLKDFFYGKEMSSALSHLKRKWIESEYQANKEKLLEMYYKK